MLAIATVKDGHHLTNQAWQRDPSTGSATVSLIATALFKLELSELQQPILFLVPFEISSSTSPTRAAFEASLAPS